MFSVVSSDLDASNFFCYFRPSSSSLNLTDFLASLSLISLQHAHLLLICHYLSMGGCGSGVEPTSWNQKVAGSVSLVWITVIWSDAHNVY